MLVGALLVLLLLLASIAAFRWRFVGDEYVRVEDDGSWRELTSDEQVYLAEDFLPGDSGRPYVKDYYEQRTPTGSIAGFMLRQHLPQSARGR